MEITPVGWVCIVVGLACLTHPRWLAALVATSTVFSATAVVNLPALSFGLQPYHWFGALLFGAVVLREEAPWRTVFGALHASAAPLYGFLAWAVLSMLVNPAPGTSLVHLAHLGLGTSVLLAVRLVAREPGQLRTLARALVVGTVFAAAWGVLQFAFHLVGLPYPDTLFNNSVGESAGGYVSTVLKGLLPRVSSVSTEPSFLVRSLLPALVLVVLVPAISPDTRRRRGMPPSRDWSVWLMVAVALLSTSTTGLVGLAAIALGVVALVPGARWYAGGALALVGLALAWTYTQSPVFASLADELVLRKAELGSGGMRTDTVQAAFAEFLASPLVGAGPGQVTSDDTIVKLLSNYGLVGAAFLGWAMAGTLRAAWIAIRRGRRPHLRGWLLALAGANAVLWAMDLAAGLSYTYGVFWVLWALLLAAVEASEDEAPGEAAASPP
jgi:hypothetical protein